MTSCGDLGWVVLQIDAAVDNQTTKLRLGYLIKLLSGSLPKGLRLPKHAVLAGPDRKLQLSWPDGRGIFEKPALEFELTIQAVDRAGNVGSPSTPLAVSSR